LDNLKTLSKWKSQRRIKIKGKKVNSGVYFSTVIFVYSFPGDEAPWLVFEFMDYGDLASLLRTLTAEGGGKALASDPESSLPSLTTVSSI